ncbi:class B sortase, LPKTxAVK-specific [Streptococcus merionis]|uniref:Sortase B putative n=1 Tax=Streptococcus merionis TaxID=400065 RepID=A0A239SXM4_9STRE|nr:class B sortase, LPKTxAVK-specific [Streptococcus merionis]SNU90197.1 sortase B putative [Streptococcus merionis]
MSFKNAFPRLVILISFLTLFLLGCSQKSNTSEKSKASTMPLQIEKTYTVSEEEKAARKEQFEGLRAVNPEAVGYVYAPGTMLDEPVVQTTDNATYLDKTFEGGHEPYMGAVFMDADNKADFSDQLTWLFGHARGSKVPDHRMFNDVNFYDDQAFFDQHPYVVVQTPERNYYYEAAFLIIVPETTAFYKTEFASKEEFAQQLTEVSELAHTKNPNIKVSKDDKYLVLSTCREDDETIRSNLYLRQIPDSEMVDFLAANQDKLTYTPTR